MESLHLGSKARARHVAIPAALLAALWFAMLTLGAGQADGLILAAMYAGDEAWLAAVALLFTTLGDAPVLVAISLAAAAWLLWKGRARHAFAVIAVTMIGRGLVHMQKYSIARLRPDELEKLVNATNPSFPSGHSASSMIVYLTIALALSSGSRWTRAAVLAAGTLSILIGLSRMILGVHWPSDVVGGWSFGLLWVLLTLPMAERLARIGPHAVSEPGGSS